MAESEEELKRFMMMVKEESGKVGLKPTFEKVRSWHHFITNGWETMETVTEFIFWAPKSLQIVTATMKLNDACSLEEKL